MTIERSATNRRQAGRWMSLTKALIIPGRGESVRCTAVNWGPGGALLQVDDYDGALETFNLLIGDEDMLVTCNVAHRVEARIGVQFLGAPMRASRFGAMLDPRGQRPASGLLLREGSFSLEYRRRT